MQNTHDAYLHVISGGFNELKRKQVRQLFQTTPDKDPEPDLHDNTCYDLIVGALEEIHAVGVKSFNSNDLTNILDIFKVSIFISGDLASYVERALSVMSIPRHEDYTPGKLKNERRSIYTTPTPAVLEVLHRQHCPDERVEERKAQLIGEGLNNA